MEINSYEKENVEFKSVASGNLPDSIWETITAFSNADGGTIFFGVDDNGNISGVNKKNVIN